jgi:hypothetical protein
MSKLNEHIMFQAQFKTRVGANLTGYFMLGLQDEIF